MEDERRIQMLRKKAWTLFEAKHHDEAFKLWDEAVQSAGAPASATILLEKGEALTRLQRHQEALAVYDRAVTDAPENPAALTARGKCLERLGRVGDALVSYERALRVSPNDHAALGALGNALAEVGRFEEALPYFDRILELKPRDAEAMLCRGLLLWKTKSPADGLREIERAIDTQPKLIEAYIHRARVLRAMGKLAEARAAAEDAIKRSPKFVDGYVLAAELAIEDGQPEQAFGYCDKALAIHPGEAEAWRLKSLAHAKLGREAASIVCRGLYHMHRGELEQALAEMDRAIATDPKFAHGWTHRGSVLERLERWEEALAAYDRSLEIDGRDPRVLMAKGLLLHDKLRRAGEGMALLRKAVAIDPKRWNDLPDGLKKWITKPLFW